MQIDEFITWKLQYNPETKQHSVAHFFEYDFNGKLIASLLIDRTFI
jgi:hypothetical protein